MPSSRASAFTVCAVVGAAALTFAGAAIARAPRPEVPTRLADSTFWRLVTTFSEPTGSFSSENFVSNEAEWQYVIPDVMGRAKLGGAYLGVGPEQNFTYMAAFRPSIAFICDIRRQNLVQHLMYKALMEMSPDRVEFLSKLWSRPRPDGLDTTSEPGAIVAAYRAEQSDSLLHALNLGAIFARLVNEHGFALTSEDSATMRAVYGTFVAAGPDLSYSSSSRNPGSATGLSVRASSLTGGPGFTWIPGNTGSLTVNAGGTITNYRIYTDSLGRISMTRDSAGVYVPDSTFSFRPGLPSAAGAFPSLIANYPTFGSLMSEHDGAGMNRGWLASEGAYQWLRDFQVRNLIVPVVGNFAGPKALRSIGQYLAEHNVRVRAFYTSNVEQYLFQDRLAGKFYENVAMMPTDSSSFFVRSFPNTFRGSIVPRNPRARLAQTTSPIATVLGAHQRGELRTYLELAQLQEQ